MAWWAWWRCGGGDWVVEAWCGGVWKKVKSKEKSGRCICVGRRKLGKNKKGKIYILLRRYIILMSRIGK